MMQFHCGEKSVQKKTSLCPICGAGCLTAFDVSESGEILSAQPAVESVAGDGSGCRQRQFLLAPRFQPRNRLGKPLVWCSHGYREANWPDVLDLVAERLKGCGPWETAVLADTRLTTEELFLLQKFARTVLRTNLVGCITPPGQAAAAELLKRAGRQPEGLQGGLQGLSEAACVLALGVDPEPGLPFAELVAKATDRNGTERIVANPEGLESDRHAAFDLRHARGTEAVLIGGIVHLLLETHAVDAAFAEQHRSIIHRLKRQLAGYGPVQVARRTGVRTGELLDAARLLGEGGRQPLTVVCGPHFMQSGHVKESLEAIMTLLHLTGSVGRAGGGIIPLYGSGNFQGASELGMITQLFGIPGDCGSRSGASRDNIREMFGSARIKVAYLALNSCDSKLMDFLSPFLQQVDLVILHDLLHAASLPGSGGTPPAQVVLPMAAVLEKGGSFSDIDGTEVHLPPVLAAPGESRSSIWVIEELARRMGVPGFAYPEEDLLRQEIHKQIAANGTVLQRSHRRSACCVTSSKSCGGRSQSNPSVFLPDWNPAPIEAWSENPFPDRGRCDVVIPR